MESEGLIGRDAELDVLGEFLRLPLASAQALVLRGEPGIGKTTLWLHGVEVARASAYRVLSCRPAEAEAGFSFGGLIDLLAEAVGDVGERVPDVQRRALESALLLGDQAQVDARLVSVAALNAVRVLAEAGPLLLAIDDLQWLDAPSARVLAYALRRLETEPVAVLATLRSEAPLPAGLEQALAQRHASFLDLGPLPAAPLRQLVRSRVDASLPQAALSRLARVSRGNPLHALELARWAAEEPSSQGLPDLEQESLTSTLARRLERLPQGTRGAVVTIFALSNPTPSLVGRSLAGAVKAGVAERDGHEVRLAHPLLGVILYDGLTIEERRSLHARLAGLPLTDEERARHLALSIEGSSPAIARELDKAAAAARARGAVDAAAELSGLALGLTPPKSTEAISRRLFAVALDEYRAGDTARARERWEAVLREEPPGPARARAAWHLLEFYGAPSMRDYDSLIRTGLAGAADDPELRGRVHISAASIWLWGGDMRRVRGHLRQGLPLVEASGDNAIHAHALAIGAVERFLAGARAGAGAGADPHAFDQALALARGAEAVPLDLDPRFQRAFVHVTTGDDLVATRADLVQLLALAREIGEDAALPLLHAFLAETEALAGDAEQVERNIAEAERWAEVVDVHNRRGQILYLRALARMLRGDLEQARDLAAEALAFDDARAVLMRTAPNRALLGTILRWLGKDGEAVGVFEQARRELEAGGNREPSLYRFMPANVEALIAIGELKQAEVLATSWAASARRVKRASALAGVRECEAALLGANGDMDAALEAYGRARLAYEELGYRFDAARMVLASAHLARRSRKKSVAAASFAEAAGLFDSIGATGWADRARHELGRIAIGQREPSALTESERRIATLVASGSRNREIADSLVVSQKTVETHLTHIYEKLGITSRSQLVARVAAEPDLLARL